MKRRSNQVDSNEAEWLEQARQGDREAFGRLVEAYQRPVFNLCWRMLGNSAEAEDAAQETFIKAYRGLSRYDPQRSFTNWILSIASHHCIDQLRRRRLPLISIDEGFSGSLLIDSAMGPEPSMETYEHQVRVQRLLGALRPKDRAAVIMRYWYDFSYAEIAEALSTSIPGIKSRLHRARRELAEAWQGDTLQRQGKRGKRDEAFSI